MEILEMLEVFVASHKHISGTDYVENPYNGKEYRVDYVERVVVEHLFSTYYGRNVSLYDLYNGLVDRGLGHVVKCPEYADLYLDYFIRHKSVAEHIKSVEGSVTMHDILMDVKGYVNEAQRAAQFRRKHADKLLAKLLTEHHKTHDIIEVDGETVVAVDLIKACEGSSE